MRLTTYDLRNDFTTYDRYVLRMSQVVSLENQSKRIFKQIHQSAGEIKRIGAD